MGKMDDINKSNLEQLKAEYIQEHNLSLEETKVVEGVYINRGWLNSAEMDDPTFGGVSGGYSEGYVVYKGDGSEDYIPYDSEIIKEMIKESAFELIDKVLWEWKKFHNKDIKISHLDESNLEKMKEYYIQKHKFLSPDDIKTINDIVFNVDGDYIHVNVSGFEYKLSREDVIDPSPSDLARYVYEFIGNSLRRKKEMIWDAELEKEKNKNNAYQQSRNKNKKTPFFRRIINFIFGKKNNDTPSSYHNEQLEDDSLPQVEKISAEELRPYYDNKERETMEKELGVVKVSPRETKRQENDKDNQLQ